MLVSEKKRNKGKEILARIVEELSKRRQLCHKQLERDHGFLIYLSRTYKSMRSYLKDFYQMLDSWKKGKDEEGWKIHLTTKISH